MSDLPGLDIAFGLIPPPPKPELLDRSLLERYSRCPFMGWAVETGQVRDVSFAADSGSECHRVVSEAVGEFTRGGDALDYLRQEGPKMRPDVQHDAWPNLRRSMYGIVRVLRYRVPPSADFPQGILRHPDDVVRWQGGPANEDPALSRSGQLARVALPATKSRGDMIVTSEIDLLLAGEGRKEMVELDFKRWACLNSDEIKASFQFRLHAWLVFGLYPELEVLRVSIWSIPRNLRTPEAAFTRYDAEDFASCLYETLRYRDEAFAKVAEGKQPECWPHPDKCLLCPAIHICPRALDPALRLREDPIKFAQDTAVMAIELGKRQADLRKLVDEQQHDIVGDGVAFGLDKPKAAKKNSAAQYGFYTPILDGVADDEQPPDDAQALQDELAEALTTEKAKPNARWGCD